MASTLRVFSSTESFESFDFIICENNLHCKVHFYTLDPLPKMDHHLLHLQVGANMQKFVSGPLGHGTNIHSSPYANICF